MDSEIAEKRPVARVNRAVVARLSCCGSLTSVSRSLLPQTRMYRSAAAASSPVPWDTSGKSELTDRIRTMMQLLKERIPPT